MTRHHHTRSFLILLMFFCVAALVVVVYWPGLNGPFIMDDMWNLGALSDRGGVTNPTNALAFVFSNTSGALGRPLSMASFLLSDQHWPGDEFSFKFHNLMFHLLNGVLLFYLVFLLSKLSGYREQKALIIATIVGGVWMLHPLNVSTTLYVVQRMTQLSSLFCLAGMICYVIARTKARENASGTLRFLFLALVLFPLLAVLSKENGILIFGYYLLLEWVFLSTHSYSKIMKVWLALPLIGLLVYLLSKFDSFLRTYSFRDFTLLDRLYTEPLVLLDYLLKILVPSGRGTGLMQDDFPVLSTFLGPDFAVLPILGLAMIIIVAIALRRTVPMACFGLCWFFVGHSLESTFIPLEIYFEHRNYLPMQGVVLGCVAILFYAARKLSLPLRRGVVILFVTLYAGIALASTQQSVKIWGNLFDLLTFWATEHPDSLRAQRVYGQFLGRGPEWADVGQRILADAYKKRPDDISLPLIMYNIGCKHGLVSPVAFSDIMRRSQDAYYHGGLITEVKKFANLYLDGKCKGQIDESMIHELLENISNAHGMRGGQKADLLFFHAQKYADLGYLDFAMERLDQAGKYQQDFVVPFRQAQYLASAGLYEESLQYIEKAKRWDKNRVRAWIVPGNTDLIARFEQRINYLQANKEAGH